MKKNLLSIAMFLLFVSASFSETKYFSDSSDTFLIEYAIPKKWKEVQNEKKSSIPVVKSYEMTMDYCDGMVQFSLYEEYSGDFDNYEKRYKNQVINIYSEATGDYSVFLGGHLPMVEIEKYICKKVNADKGYMMPFVVVDKNSTVSNYKYMMLQFFFKYGQGLVMYSYHSDNNEFFGFSEDLTRYNPDASIFSEVPKFRFYDIDKSTGEYIIDKKNKRK